MAKPKKENDSKKQSPFTMAAEMRDNPVLWGERSPEFRKAYSQFMINRLLSLDPGLIFLLELIISRRKFTDMQHHDCIVCFMKKKQWRFSWNDYSQFYPRNDAKLIRAISMYYELGTEDAKSIAARMDDKAKNRMLALTGMAKDE